MVDVVPNWNDEAVVGVAAGVVAGVGLPKRLGLCASPELPEGVEVGVMVVGGANENADLGGSPCLEPVFDDPNTFEDPPKAFETPPNGVFAPFVAPKGDGDGDDTSAGFANAPAPKTLLCALEPNDDDDGIVVVFPTFPNTELVWASLAGKPADEGAALLVVPNAEGAEVLGVIPKANLCTVGPVEGVPFESPDAAGLLNPKAEAAFGGSEDNAPFKDDVPTLPAEPGVGLGAELVALDTPNLNLSGPGAPPAVEPSPEAVAVPVGAKFVLWGA